METRLNVVSDNMRGVCREQCPAMTCVCVLEHTCWCCSDAFDVLACCRWALRVEYADFLLAVSRAESAYAKAVADAGEAAVYRDSSGGSFLRAVQQMHAQAEVCVCMCMCVCVCVLRTDWTREQTWGTSHEALAEALADQAARVLAMRDEHIASRKVYACCVVFVFGLVHRGLVVLAVVVVPEGQG